MPICGFCGSEVNELRQCRRCGGRYCDDCFMPENHNCVGSMIRRSKVESEKRRILLEILAVFILAGVFLYLLFALTRKF